MPEEKQVPILVCKVAGVTFGGRQKILQRLLKGKDMQDIMVFLDPEPENQYDPNAIKVLAVPSREQIGYIPREACEDMLWALEQGRVHNRQRATIGCTAKKNGGFIYWASLRVYEAAVSKRERGGQVPEKPKTYPNKPRRVIELIDWEEE